MFDRSRFATHRSPVFAGRGMVATSHPSATAAGLGILRDGGNAVDAALATAIALTVVEPTSNGIGGDLFAIVWDGRELHGLNGSGHSPAALTLDLVHSRGGMPLHGWLPVTVPGAPRAWADLHARFGSLGFDHLVAPALEFAESGHVVPVTVAQNWARAVRSAQTRVGPEFDDFLRTFAPSGRAPRPGELVRNRAQAQTLRRLARSIDSFYTGEIASDLVAFAQETGGLLTADDLASHASTWVNPISVDYQDHSVVELPPNGQGVAVLAALEMLKRLPAGSEHYAVEAVKLGLGLARAEVADPATMRVDDLLSPGRLEALAARITDRAGPSPDSCVGGTVYLATADADGMMVSLIQSNYHGFGSGVVAPGGISLQNRGCGFSLDPGHPNIVGPRKRSFHTIIPGFLMSGGHPVGPFGVMGGDMQAQGHVQVLRHLLEEGFDPQSALDAPRWRVEGGDLLVEPELPQGLQDDLRRRGHRVRVEPDRTGFGRGQLILRLDSGAFVAGSESRCDGCALGW